MKNQSLRSMAFLAGISILGLLMTQAWWFREAFHLKSQQNQRSIGIALQEVANELLRYRKHEALPDFPVRKVSDDYFVVMVNDEIDPDLLEVLLVRSLQKRNLHFDFEYGVYDCSSNRMVDGRYVSAGKQAKSSAATHTFPRIYHENTYFGVYFPELTADIIGQLPIWLFSTLVIVVIILFFLYSLWVLFQQKRWADVQRDFVNNMMHEFKTPLATLSVSAEVLNKDEILHQPERYKQYSRILLQETQRLKSQIDRLLTVSIFEKPGLRLSMETFDLREKLQLCLDRFAEKVQVEGGTLRWEMPDQAFRVHADAYHLEAAVQNILDNALKYGSPPVEIDVRLRQQGRNLVLEIADNGPGIPKAERKKVFQKFYRISNHLVHDVKGFGLGLYYVKQVVRLHKGRVSIADTERPGSLFLLTLPLHHG